MAHSIKQGEPSVSQCQEVRRFKIKIKIKVKIRIRIRIRIINNYFPSKIDIIFSREMRDKDNLYLRE